MNSRNFEKFRYELNKALTESECWWAYKLMIVAGAEYHCIVISYIMSM